METRISEKTIHQTKLMHRHSPVACTKRCAAPIFSALIDLNAISERLSVPLKCAILLTCHHCAASDKGTHTILPRNTREVGRNQAVGLSRLRAKNEIHDVLISKRRISCHSVAQPTACAVWAASAVEEKTDASQDAHIQRIPHN